MRFIYTSDIHGDINKYELIIDLCKENNIEYLVLGGDLFSKERGDRIQIQKEFIDNYLDSYFDKLNKENIKVILIMGNDDLVIPSNYFFKTIKKYKNVYDINRKEVVIDNISFIGLNVVLDAPFRIKDNVVTEKGQEMPAQLSDQIYIDNCSKVISVKEWEEYRKTKLPLMEDELKALPKPSKDKVIYVLHDPPYGVGLDVCHNGFKAGSNAIYKFIEKSNAYLSLHGHIHESYDITNTWKVKIGNTTSIQMGQSMIDGPLHYAIIDTNKNTIDFNIK